MVSQPDHREQLSDQDDPVLALLEQMRVANDRQVADALNQEAEADGQSQPTVGLGAAQVDTKRRMELPPVELPETIGRFRVESILGQGGYGLVLRAMDPSLKRRVALKIPRTGVLLTEELQQRFVREAEAAAALNHAHIVPVYEVGRSGPICYIASAYCEGESLAQRLGRTGRVEPKQAAQLTATLAEAVQHAHSRGVLHRDLKPGNVLLTRDPAVDGQPTDETASTNWPMITDFGLAHIENDEQRVTATGSILGTPAYMAPEQASGDPSTASALADVYSLGAILYELLSGRPPFAGATILETLDKVRHQDPAPLRRGDQTIPRDLEAITLKCLEKQPASRYATCSDLAADLDRFLRNEPVHARRSTTVERAVRWCRRQPLQAAFVATLFLGLLTVSVVSSVAYRQVSQAREAEAERRSQLRDSLDAQLSVVLEDLLSRQQELTDDHRAYLQAALDSYQQFAVAERQDRESREGVASAFGRLGDIHTRLGDTIAAAAAYRGSIDRFKQLADDFPDDASARRDQVRMQNRLAKLLKEADQLEAAEAVVGDAIATMNRLIQRSPAVAADRYRLAALYGSLGMMQMRASRFEDAEQAYRQAQRVLETLAEESPSEYVYRAQLGANCGNLAQLMAAQRRWAEAESLFVQARDLQRQLVDENPGDRRFQADLANSVNGLGMMALVNERMSEAEEAYREGLTINQSMAAEFPANASYQSRLVTSYDNLSKVLVKTDRHELAEQNWRNAVGILRRLISDFPEIPDYHAKLGETLLSLAELALDKGDTAAANELADEGRAHLEVALNVNDRHPFFLNVLAHHHVVGAQVLLALGQYGEAAEAAELVLEQPLEPAQSPFVAAQVYARCVELANGDEALDQSRREELARRYSDRAVASLEQAVSAGLCDANRIVSDPDLRRLASRDDVQALLKKIEDHNDSSGET